MMATGATYGTGMAIAAATTGNAPRTGSETIEYPTEFDGQSAGTNRYQPRRQPRTIRATEVAMASGR